MQLDAGFLASNVSTGSRLISMSFRRPLWRIALFLFSANLFAWQHGRIAATPPASLPALPQDATQYVREVVKNQISADANDHTHWRYRIHREDEKGSQDRDVIDTREGQLARTLLINGRALTAEERASDEARMKKLVEDPSERAKREKREKDDSEKATQMFKAIPDAFVFKYDGEENGQVRLTFFPNPHYDAPTRELQVFKSMSGRMWIDHAVGRLTRLEGTLFEDVTFGWGLLGRLNKGGTFSIAQSRVSDDHWEIIALDVKMSGKAVIFKSINVKQMQRLTEFRRVSDDLTIAQAYKLLLAAEAVSAESHPRAVSPQNSH